MQSERCAKKSGYDDRESRKERTDKQSLALVRWLVGSETELDRKALCPAEVGSKCDFSGECGMIGNVARRLCLWISDRFESKVVSRPSLHSVSNG